MTVYVTQWNKVGDVWEVAGLLSFDNRNRLRFDVLCFSSYCQCLSQHWPRYRCQIKTSTFSIKNRQEGLCFGHVLANNRLCYKLIPLLEDEIQAVECNATYIINAKV